MSKTLVAAVATVVSLAIGSGTAFAGKVHFKNCLKDRVYVCAYNADDKTKDIAAEQGGIQPGDKKTFKCDTKNCRIFAAVAEITTSRYLEDANLVMRMGGAAAIAGGGAAGTTVGIIALRAGSMAAGEASVAAWAAGAVVAAGTAVAIIATIDAVNNSDKCKKIIKEAKKGDGLREKLSGDVTLTPQVHEGEDGSKTLVLVLEDGHNACK